MAWPKEGRRRTLAMGLVIALLAATAWVAGPYIDGTQTLKRTEVSTVPQKNEEDDSDAIAAFRTERQQLRAMQRGQLQEIAADETTSAAISEEARRQIINMAEWSEQETTIEGVLKMRGYREAVATVHEDSVNVLVRADSLSEQECAVILELATRETGKSAENIKIIPIN